MPYFDNNVSGMEWDETEEKEPREEPIEDDDYHNQVVAPQVGGVINRGK